MNTHLRTLALGATIVAVLAAAPALYAQSYLSMSHGSKMDQGMGDGGVMGMMGGMMSGMMNMMGMSGDMGGMMEHCGQMMQGTNADHADRPNDQWRSPRPEQPIQPRD
jgi:membrane protease subunit (stomatin/prohibitin family)